MDRHEKDVIWLGDSLSVLQQFPKSVRVDLGSDLRRLQIGEMPLDSKLVRTVGPGVRELRARDRDNQFPTIYVIPKGDDIIVLHMFIKKSRTTAKTDINLGAIKEFQPELRNGVCNDGNQNYPR